MTQAEFIQVIKTAIFEAAARSVLNELRSPAGRKPKPKITSLSEWYSAINDGDQRNVAEVAKLASRQATYNFLSILDGLMPVDTSTEKGRLELAYIRSGVRNILNSPDGEELTAQFKSVTAE